MRKSIFTVGEEFTDQDIQRLAEGINDFIYEYDTYGYRDVGIDREEMVQAIHEQLKELKVLEQAIRIYYSELYSDDEKFTDLSKLLTV